MEPLLKGCSNAAALEALFQLKNISRLLQNIHNAKIHKYGRNVSSKSFLYFIHLTTELVWYSMAKIRKMHFLIDSLEDNKVNSIVISNYLKTLISRNENT